MSKRQVMQGPMPARWPIFLAAAILTCLVGAVFFPIVGFEFVDYDVSSQVVNNAHIRGLNVENLKHIFTSQCVLSYYPVRTLTFAVDYQLWGLNPAGFKLTNGLLHLANVLLVFWLILRLFGHPASTIKSATKRWDLSIATFSAGVFAVHPVVVEPVAWVAGREELLMTLGALGCMHFHFTARRESERSGRTLAVLACYAGAAFSCAVACLSNAVAAVIPLLIVAWDMLTLPRPKPWKIVSATSALWAISAATVVVKIHSTDRELVMISESAAFSAERLMLILNVYWLNLKTLVWPVNLAFLYSPVRPESFLEAEVILGGMTLGLTFLILYMLKRRRLLLLGLFWFGLALGPASGIFPHHVHRADRLLYLPLIGLAVAAAASLRPLGNALQRRAVVAVTTAGVSVLLLLNVLSARQVQTWRDSLSLWEHGVSVDPNNSRAHDSLGRVLEKRGQLARAEKHFQRAIELDFNDAVALRKLAWFHATSEDEQFRDYDMAIRLAKRACDLTEWEDPKMFRGLAIVYSSFAASLANDGVFGPAIDNFNNAILADRSYDLPHYNLALLLANCPDARLRNADEAVRLAERARQLTKQPSAEHLKILAEVYAAAGRPGEAVRAVEEAIRTAEAAGHAESAQRLRSWLESFRRPSSSHGSGN